MYSIPMPRRLWLSASVAAVALVVVKTGAVAGQQDQQPAMSLQPAGLRIVAPPPEDDHRFWMMMPFQHWRPGTTLALRLERPAGDLLTIDTDRSTIEHFSDSTGKDLLAVDDRLPFHPGPQLSAQVSKHRSAALVEVEAPGLPAAGAHAVRAHGILVLQMGTEIRTGRQEAVPVAEDARIDEAGPIPFTISNARHGQDNFGNPRPEITLRARLRTHQELNKIVAIRFLDADDQQIESPERGSFVGGDDDGVTIERTYVLDRQADALTVEIDYWSEVETVELPFDVEVTIGGWDRRGPGVASADGGAARR